MRKRALEDHELEHDGRVAKSRNHEGAAPYDNSKVGVEDAALVTEADYIVANGLRYVVPYEFQFKVNCKERWMRKSLLDVFAWEFPHRDRSYWEEEALSGRLLVRGRPVQDPEAALISPGDYVTHLVHRHETPVQDLPIRLVREDERVVIVDKPSSLPVHPCGTFRKNSLIYLLALQHGLTGLFIVHRIDRQTSGLVIMARSARFASEFSEKIRQHEVKKLYVALAVGRFPDGETTVAVALSYDNHEKKGSCDPLNGKPAETRFIFQWYDPDRNMSLVQCLPRSGRTHQIRLHLEYLGHPLVNDPLYGDPSRRPQLMEGGQSHPVVPDHARRQGELLNCVTCPEILARADFRRDDGFMYLHALEYSGPEFSYVTQIPDWANQPKPTESKSPTPS
mmetsp:Transcript_16696/g.34312  ORF Transcript_16696/g.34312 Transcript_16696/m.34312 type:complete len:394 (-) Transcript_16696:792-1973(-)